jgi:hypothetical protein
VTHGISSAVPRRRTTVRGRITSVTTSQRPWVRTDVEIADGTGALVLRFLGRSGVPGMVAGRRVTAEGTPSHSGKVLVMLNPLYSFDDAG